MSTHLRMMIHAYSVLRKKICSVRTNERTESHKCHNMMTVVKINEEYFEYCIASAPVSEMQFAVVWHERYRKMTKASFESVIASAASK